jgi:hypothetical protein
VGNQFLARIISENLPKNQAKSCAVLPLLANAKMSEASAHPATGVAPNAPLGAALLNPCRTCSVGAVTNAGR